MNDRTKIFAALSLALALAVFLGMGAISAVSGNGQDVLAEEMAAAGKDGLKVIHTEGRGKIAVAPDVAYVEIGVATQEETATVASRNNNEKMKKLYEAIKTLGVEEKDLKTLSVTVNPLYQHKSDVPGIYAFEARNIVQIKIINLEKTGAIVAAAIDAGGNTVQSISYDLINKKEAYAKALAEAVKDARAKAEIMAEASSVKLETQPLSIQESSSIHYPGNLFRNARYKMDVPAAGGAGADATPLASSEIIIEASIAAEYVVTP